MLAQNLWRSETLQSITMIDNNPKKIYWLCWTHDLVFSILLVLLLVSGHEGAGSLSWSVRLRNLFLSSPPSSVAMTDNNFGIYVVAFMLIWTSTVLIFVLVRLLRGFHRIDFILLSFTGFVAMAGYPIVSLYSRTVQAPFMTVELLLAIGCFTLWAWRKWPVSAPLTTLLLIVHFSLWASFSTFPFLCCLYLWPGWVWNWGGNIGAKMRLVYPLLSLCSALLWTIAARQAGKIRSLHEQETS
jgi:hypothetical protein